MKLNKFLTRTIVVTLLLTFLTFSVGRVNRVSAVGTVATVAGTALLATGVIYMSYLALTGAQMRIPVVDDIELWLKDIGTKVVQYPSGSAAYQEMYEYYSMHDPIANVIDGVWTWTEDKLKSFVNDFADTRIIDNIVSYAASLDISQIPTNTFDYSFDFTAVPNLIYDSGVIRTYSEYCSRYNATITPLEGASFIYSVGGLYTIINSDILYPVRNYKNPSGLYSPQVLINDVWTNLSSITSMVASVSENGRTFSLVPHIDSGLFDAYSVGSPTYYVYTNTTYPLFPQERIYDSTTGEYIDLVEVNSTELFSPNWNDPDNDNRPVVPWVPIPELPATIDVPSGYTGIDQWGFNLEDLLDNLSDLGESIFDLAVLKELINSFAGLHGDDYYLYYDNGDTNYYTYYQPTIYEGDYITYNYDISDHEEVMPVNLNDIQLYTDNRYLDAVKENVANFGQAIGEYFAFWHNVDYELTYILFGCAILTLVAMFIGKWGK